MQNSLLSSLEPTMGHVDCKDAHDAVPSLGGPRTCPERRGASQKVMKATRGMNKESQGFRGKRAHLDGEHKEGKDS